MSDKGIVRVALPAADLAALDAIRDETLHTRNGLVSAIVRQWLRSADHALPTPDLRELHAVQAVVAKERAEILEQWKEVRRSGGRTVETNTAEFLAKLARQGRKLCRATLYNWSLRMQAHGLAGLTDLRRERRRERRQTAAR